MNKSLSHQKFNRLIGADCIGQLPSKLQYPSGMIMRIIMRIITMEVIIIIIMIIIIIIKILHSAAWVALTQDDKRRRRGEGVL